jgi:hypothetical protein
MSFTPRPEIAMSSFESPDHLDRLALRRARRKLGWYLHALAYVCVNLALVALSLYHGRHWAVFPLLGWGLGLALHAVAVFAAAPGSRVFESLLQRERAALSRERAAAPW